MPTWCFHPPWPWKACGLPLPCLAQNQLMVPHSFPFRAWEWAGSQRLGPHLRSLAITGLASEAYGLWGGRLHTGSKVKLLDGVQGISALGTKRSEDAGPGDKDGGRMGRGEGPDSQGWCERPVPWLSGRRLGGSGVSVPHGTASRLSLSGPNSSSSVALAECLVCLSATHGVGVKGHSSQWG